MAVELLGLSGALVRKGALDFEELAGVGKSRRVRFDLPTAQLASLVASVAAFNLGKRGVECSSLLLARAWSVG
jgi:hypothetical protein